MELFVGLGQVGQRPGPLRVLPVRQLANGLDAELSELLVMRGGEPLQRRRRRGENLVRRLVFPRLVHQLAEVHCRVLSVRIWDAGSIVSSAPSRNAAARHGHTVHPAARRAPRSDQAGSRTTAAARPSTVLPSNLAEMSTRAVRAPSSATEIDLTVPVSSRTAPSVGSSTPSTTSGTGTGRVNRAW